MTKTWSLCPLVCAAQMLSSLTGGCELNTLPETTCTERPDSKSPGAPDPSLTHQSVLPGGSSLCESVVVLINHPPIETVYVAASVSKASV